MGASAPTIAAEISALLTSIRDKVFGPAPALPVVQSAAAKLQWLGDKFNVQQNDLLNRVLQNGAKYVDNANNGNINVFMQRPDGPGFIRVTLDPTQQRVISAGLNQANDVLRGITSGRFTPLP